MEQNEINKEYAIKALLRIKSIQANYFKLRELGVDLINYESGINMIEQSIALLFTKKESDYESALLDILWWLYEDVDKMITLADKTKVDVNTPESFISWLEEWYRKS